MKSFARQRLSPLFVPALLSFALAQPPILAQGFAPAGLANSVLAVTISGGASPFANSGSYKIFTSAAGTNYVLLGNAGADLSFGGYAYSKTGANSGVLALGSSGVSVALTFNSASVGSVALTKTGSAGFQTGALTLTNLGAVGVPGMLEPAAVSNRFQAWVSGVEGVTYSVEGSTNFSAWSVVTNLQLPDLSTPFSESLANARARFYRARVLSNDFAPASVAGMTFGMTITGGAAPLPANGIYQLNLSASNNTYQILGGSGVTNSSGTYSYARLGANCGALSLVDSLFGNLNERLAFTSPSAGQAFTTNSGVGFQWSRFLMTPGATVFFGNVGFTPDTARKVSVHVPGSLVSNAPLTKLSVTNADGYIWSLVIPSDATVLGQTISMTPFASINSSNCILPIVSGVLLEPDGAQFVDGVTLSVTAPSLHGTHASLLMGGQDGSDLRFVANTNFANTFSTTLFHFTSGGASDPTDQEFNDFVQRWLPQIQAAYQDAVNRLKALERVVIVPPEPPDFELTCDGAGEDAGRAAIDRYVDELFKKEIEVINEMLGYARELLILGHDPGDEPINLARELIEKSGYRKIESLFRGYRNNPKKFFAIADATLWVMRQDVLLGGPDGLYYWKRDLDAWGDRTVDYYLDRLRNQHDYRAWDEARRMRLAAPHLDSSNPVNLDQFEKDLNDAFAFKLTTEITVSGPENLDVKGSVTLTNNLLNFNGVGSMSYLSGDVQGFPLVTPLSFSQLQKIEHIETCTNFSCDLILSPLGANELYVLPQVGPTSFGNTLEGLVYSNFQDNSAPDLSKYTFHVQIRNLNVEAVNQTFTQSDGVETVSVNLVLTHHPL